MPRDARFTALENALGDAPETPSLALPTDTAQASVALVLREAPSLEILLIKRAESKGDPWSGQMALPGGRRGSDDSTLLATAIRETAEETGVVLTEQDHYLGALEPTVPSTSRIPPITIHPFVFGVPNTTRAVADGREVESVHWASVEALTDPANAEAVEWPTPSGLMTFPGYGVDGHVVWGLTYRMLTGFLELIAGKL